MHDGGVLCGQTMMAAADTAMVLAVMTHLGGFKPMTTVQLQTSFLRPIAGEQRHGARRGARAAHGPQAGVRRDRRSSMRATSWRRTPPPPTRCCERRWRFDYRTAFELAPIGLVLSRQRLMIDCNRAGCWPCSAPTREQLVGQSFEMLYPTHDEFERTGQRIVASLDATAATPTTA